MCSGHNTSHPCPFKRQARCRLTVAFVPQIVKDNELGALEEALSGKYVTPGPGGDPIRNPGVLPTGKNIHALDPQVLAYVSAGSAFLSAPARSCVAPKKRSGISLVFCLST